MFTGVFLFSFSLPSFALLVFVLLCVELMVIVGNVLYCLVVSLPCVTSWLSCVCVLLSSIF